MLEKAKAIIDSLFTDLQKEIINDPNYTSMQSLFLMEKDNDIQTKKYPVNENTYYYFEIIGTFCASHEITKIGYITDVTYKMINNPPIDKKLDLIDVAPKTYPLHLRKEALMLTLFNIKEKNDLKSYLFNYKIENNKITRLEEEKLPEGSIADDRFINTFACSYFIRSLYEYLKNINKLESYFRTNEPKKEYMEIIYERFPGLRIIERK